MRGCADGGGGVGKGDEFAPGVVCGEDIGEEFLEIAAVDGVLVGFERCPIGIFREDGECW